MKNGKTMLSVLLTALLMVSMLTVPAFAEETKKYDVTLNVVGVNNVISDVVLEHQDALYEKYGIKINFQQFSNEQASNKLAVSFAAGGSDIDAFMFRPLDETLLFVQNGWLENLQPYIDAAPDAAKIDDCYPASLGPVQGSLHRQHRRLPADGRERGRVLQQDALQGKGH